MLAYDPDLVLVPGAGAFRWRTEGLAEGAFWRHPHEGGGRLAAVGQSWRSMVSASLTSNLPGCSIFSRLTTPSSTSME